VKKPVRHVFLDTEFTELLPRDRSDSKLISVGLVDETGQGTFYAELSDTWRVEDCSDFVRGAVLPQLRGGDARMTSSEVSRSLAQWVADLENAVQVVASSQYDIDWLWELLREAQPPANLAGARVVNLENFPGTARIEAMAAEERHFEVHGRRHHALEDALALRAGWLAGCRAASTCRP